MKESPDLHLAFDVGHSSIGWAVLQTPLNAPPNLLGCGTVIFPADDCLASQRRDFRRQRRHIRATRLRIARIAKLLEHLDVDPALTAQLALYRDPARVHELTGTGHKAPWLLAARVLRNGPLLTWIELWHVLRWYAHNRGYDGNKAWSGHEQDAAAHKDDTEKVENALRLYQKYATHTMCETWCEFCGLDPLHDKPYWPNDKRPKALNAAFPREHIEQEVRKILEKHRGILPKLDEAFVCALMKDWRTIPCEDIRLPQRFRGGLLFGQLVPRFENRIIARCPMTYERVFQRELEATDDVEHAKHEAEKLAKVPAADCMEFFRYRWVMQLANVLVWPAGEKESRRLSSEERKAIDQQAHARGYLTKTEFRKAVRAASGTERDNIDQMLLHPDAEKALVIDPVQRLVTSDALAPFFHVLPERLQKRVRGQLRQGRRLTLKSIRDDLAALGDTASFDEVLFRKLEAANTKRSKKTEPPTKEKILNTDFQVAPLSGRAPHSREIMREVEEFVISTNRHPAEEGGPIYRSETIRTAQLQRAIDERTNNHLVRHRLRILERLHADILSGYAGNDKGRVKNVTIEVNRELKELSGKSAKEIATDLTTRLSNFNDVVKKLECDLQEANLKLSPGLIRKGRIAQDLGWKCPYTGAAYDAIQLIDRAVDKDHIVPRSERASDSLDSLVITFSAVNKFKGKRTAALFIEQEQGKMVPDAPYLTIKTLKRYIADVEALETFRGHGDDQQRKKNRKRLLLLRDYVEKEFTPADLTKTSQLVRLGAQTLERHYQAEEAKPVITSLPGFYTGAVRRSWDVLGALEAANRLVLNRETGAVRTKTEIRDITHLHHALDACVMAFARLFLPRDGAAMDLLARRRLSDEQRTQARKFANSVIEITKEGQMRLADLPKKIKAQICAALAERRVVQHIPSEMRGMRAELNAWRIVEVTEGEALLRQAVRKPDGARPAKKKKEKLTKLVGLKPGKLQRLKAALVIADNYGLALDPQPQIIPFHKVWIRLREIRTQNGGRPFRVLRNGALIRVPRGNYAGVWRVFSVKNNASGLALDIGRPDVVRLHNKTEGHKINVLLASLLRDGLDIPDYSLTGVAS